MTKVRRDSRKTLFGKALCALVILACYPAKVWIETAVAQAHAGGEPAIRPGKSAAGTSDPESFDLSAPSLSIPTPAQSRINHSPSLAALPDGGLAMAWFGGSREGARDVQIFFARFDGRAWSEARPLVSTNGLIRSTGRYLTKLGNPVLHADGNRLNLWFVSVSLGGWGGARLNHSVSLDGGQIWSLPRLLVTSPFLNVSTLVRSSALDSARAGSGFKRSEETAGAPPELAGIGQGEILLPAYFELSHKYPVLLRLDARTGEVLDRQSFGQLTGLLQPSLVRKQGEPEKLSAYFRRSHALATAQVYQSDSTDGGLHWSEARPIPIPNGDASVVAWQDASARWLVANPEPGNRYSIAAYRLDSASPLPAQHLLAPVQILDRHVPPEASKGDPAAYSEFSYPSMAKTTDGRLHLVYTADGRRTVRHRIWSPAPVRPTLHGSPAPRGGGQ